MFTWICPKCGKEVPPHENECPYCHGTGKVVEPAVEAQPSPPPPPPPQHPPQQYQPPAQPAPPQPQAPPTPPQQQYTSPAAPPPPPQQQYAPPPPQQQYAPPVAPPPPQQGYAAPPAGSPQTDQYYEIDGGRKGLPGWLVMLLVAAVVVGIGYVLYTYVLPSNQSRPVAGGESPFEEVGEASPSPEALRLARHIEATGFRISEDSQQRTQLQFLVVNHSGADIGNLGGFVVLRLKEAAPDDPPLSRVEFKTEKLGPYESIEFKTVIQTELRAYEIPDWQFLTANVEITSPAGE